MLLSSKSPAPAIVDGHSLRRSESARARLILERLVKIIERRDDGEFELWCSGVQLGPDTVATAGHCFKPEPGERAKPGPLFLEFQSRGAAPVRRRISRVEWVARDDLDIALVHFSGATPLNSSLPLETERCDAGAPRIVAGFGTDETESAGQAPRSAEFAPAKRSGPIIERFTPRRAYICDGDSGGPLFCESRGRLALFAIVNGSNYCPNQSEWPDGAQAPTCRRAVYSDATRVGTLHTKPFLFLSRANARSAAPK